MTKPQKTSSITQTQLSAKHYVRLFNESPDLILLMDMAGKIIEANHHATHLFHQPKEALLNQPLTALNKSLQDTFDNLLPRLMSGAEISTEINIFDYHQNKTTPFEVRCKQIDLEGRQAIQWLGRDISTYKTLAKSSQDFTNMVVHDLRGPMGTLIGSIKMLDFLLAEQLEDLEPAEVKEIIQIALKSGQYVMDLIDSMLDVSKSEGGTLVIQVEPSNLKDLINSVKDQVMAQANAKQIQVTFPLLADDITINLDTDLMRRVFINLIDNAIKYTPSGGFVDVEFLIDEQGLQVHIRDNGPGIPKESQSKIFDKFARVSEQSEIRGVGLGLAFCKMAVEAHEGKIWLKSEPGIGSVFSFSIPPL